MRKRNLHTKAFLIKENAITLVALIVTIIVLLILAVVAIQAVQEVQEDRIISHAKNAQTKYEKAQAEEQSILESYLEKIETISISEAQNDEMLSKTTNSTTYDKYENKIVVPAGFKILLDSTTDYTKEDIDVTKGVVIQDVNGNEFVWIPVGKIYTDEAKTEANVKTITLGRYRFNSSGIESEYSGSYTEDTLENHNLSYGNAIAKDIEAFKKSVGINKRILYRKIRSRSKWI